MITDRDPGDEQPEPHADLVAALRHRDMVLRVLPVNEDAERMVDQVIARNLPRGTGRRLIGDERAFRHGGRPR